MTSVTGTYIIQYRPGSLLGEKDGAVNLQTSLENPTIFDVEEDLHGRYSIRVGDKYLAQGNNALTLVSKDKHEAWPISPSVGHSEYRIGDAFSGCWVVDSEKNELLVKSPYEIPHGPTSFNFIRVYRDD